MSGHRAAMPIAPEVLIAWLVVSALVGIAAHVSGRDGIMWFVVGIVLSPVLAGVCLMVTAAISRPAES